MANSEARPNSTIEEKTEALAALPSWTTGIVPGLASGFVMGLVLIVLSVTSRPGPLAPFPLIASIAFGSKVSSGLFAVAVGLGLHTALSAFLGALFGRFAHHVPSKYHLGLGTLFGLNVWAAVTFVILPLMNNAQTAPGTVVWSFLLGHLAYGLMLAASFPVAAEIQGPVLVRAAMIPPTIATRAVLETTERVKDVVGTVTELPKATARAIQGATERVQDAVETVTSELTTGVAKTTGLVKDVVDSMLPESTALTARKRS